MKAQFQVNFAENVLYLGDSFLGDWNHLPEKPIYSLRFSIGKTKLFLENYREYNHLIEKVSVKGGNEQVIRIMIVGRKDDGSDMFEFNLLNGKVLKYNLDKGKEFGNQLIRGWTPGIKDGEPKYRYE